MCWTFTESYRAYLRYCRLYRYSQHFTIPRKSTSAVVRTFADRSSDT